MRRFFLIFALIFLAVRAEAATIYVDLICSNGKTYKPDVRTCVGGSDLVYQTIGAGVAAMSPGDSLFIRGGTYHEYVQASIHNTIIRNYGAEHVIIENGNCLRLGDTAGPGTDIDSYVDFGGNSPNDVTCDAHAASGGVSAINIVGNYNTLKNVEIKNASLDNPVMDVASCGLQNIGNHNTISGGSIHHNGLPQGWATGGTGCRYGIYDYGSYTVIENVDIYHNGGFGIQDYNGYGGACCNEIRNNRFYDNGPDAQLFMGQGLGKRAYGNVVWMTGAATSPAAIGIYISPSCKYCSAYGNTVIGHSNGIMVENSGAATNAWVVNNITINNTTNIQTLNGVAPLPIYSNNFCNVAGTGCNTLGNPLFVAPNSPTFDFHLQQGSPAINVGTPNICTNCLVDDHKIGGVPQAPLCFSYSTDPVIIPANIANCSQAAIAIPQCGTPPGCYFPTSPDVGAYETGSPGVAIAITGPTSSSTHNTGDPTINLSGTASGASTITWSCPRCTVTSGSAGGTLAAWTANGIQLKSGINIITVQADPGAVTAMLTVTYAPSFPGNTLAGAWGFEGNANDSSANANNGTLTGGAAIISQGKYRQGLTINGVNQYVLVNDSPSLAYTRSFTLSAWVNPTVTNNTGYSATMGKGWVTLYAQSQDCGASTPSVNLYVNGLFFGAGDAYNACYPTPLQTGQWSHLAVTFDGSALKLYVNGVLRATTNLSPAPAYIEPTTDPFYIATSKYGEALNAGFVDEARTYNFAIGAGNPANFGAVCQYANYTTTVQGNPALATVVDDANCSVIPGAPPLEFKFPASATWLKASSVGSDIKFGAVVP